MPGRIFYNIQFKAISFVNIFDTSMIMAPIENIWRVLSKVRYFEVIFENKNHIQ